MTSGLSSGQRADPIFACPPQVYNELQTDGGQLRAHWQRFLQIFRSVPVQEFARRNRQAERMLRENGVTYHSVMGGGESARPWRLDLLPMLMGASEWGVIERGLAQRARLLNGLIADIYGSRRLVEQGFVPPPLLYANPEFLRPFRVSCRLRCCTPTLNSSDHSPIFIALAGLRCFCTQQN